MSNLPHFSPSSETINAVIFSSVVLWRMNEYSVSPPTASRGRTTVAVRTRASKMALLSEIFFMLLLDWLSGESHFRARQFCEQSQKRGRTQQGLKNGCSRIMNSIKVK